MIKNGTKIKSEKIGYADIPSIELK